MAVDQELGKEQCILVRCTYDYDDLPPEVALQFRHIERIQARFLQGNRTERNVDAVLDGHLLVLEIAAQIQDGRTGRPVPQQPDQIVLADSGVRFRLDCTVVLDRVLEVLEEKQPFRLKRIKLIERFYEIARILLVQGILPIGDAPRRELVHRFGIVDASLHHDVRQVAEQQDALVEAGLEQGVLQLLQDSNADEQRVRVVPQDQLVPQVEYFVQRKYVWKEIGSST